MKRRPPSTQPLYLERSQTQALLSVIQIVLDADNDMETLELLIMISPADLLALQEVEAKLAFLDRVARLGEKGGAK